MFKAVIAAGGSGTRLAPITNYVNKCFVPVGHEKLMIDLPINFFKFHGISDITILSGANHINDFVTYIGNGQDKGLTSVEYVVQPWPLGIADIFNKVKKEGCEDGILMILGDNFFSHKQPLISPFFKGLNAFVWEYDCGSLSEARSFGQMVYVDGKPVDIVEKPKEPQHSRVLTGLYYFPFDVFEKVAKLEPSKRNELEITDLLKLYLNENRLSVELTKGKWSDLGQWSSYLAFMREGK